MAIRSPIVALVLVGSLALPLVACTSGPLVNPPPVRFAPRSEAEVEQAIRKALDNRGWLAEKEAPGVMRGTLDIRTHQAVIRIRYDEQSYDIEYVSSSNLDYERKPDGSAEIHRNYNGWIANLQRDLEVLL